MSGRVGWTQETVFLHLLDGFRHFLVTKLRVVAVVPRLTNRQATKRASTRRWTGRMVKVETDMSDVIALVDEAAACAALLAATLAKISAGMRSLGTVNSFEHPQHQRSERVKSFS